MENISPNYRALKKIKDEKFDVEGLHHYNLSLQLADQNFQFCISDSKTNNCLLLEDYILNEPNSGKGLIDNLKTLFENHHLLQAGFWNSVKFSVKNRKFTLVPSSLFDKDNIQTYLRLNAHVDESLDDTFYYKHIKTDAVGIFSTKRIFTDWLNSTYTNSTVQIIHQGNALIEGVLNYEDHNNGKSMYIYIDMNYINVIITNNRQLEFYNSFSYKTTNEFFKYVAGAFQLYDLDQQHTKVIVWGDVNKNSSQFKELYAYFKNVSFGHKPSFLNFNYMFDEAEDHQYFDLYNTFLCD